MTHHSSFLVLERVESSQVRYQTDQNEQIILDKKTPLSLFIIGINSTPFGSSAVECLISAIHSIS
jgi:hypothetical protein